MDWLLLVSIIITCFVSVVLFYRQDRRNERRRTRDAVSASVRTELEAERTAAAERREKFARAMQEATRRAGKS